MFSFFNPWKLKFKPKLVVFSTKPHYWTWLDMICQTSSYGLHYKVVYGHQASIGPNKLCVSFRPTHQSCTLAALYLFVSHCHCVNTNELLSTGPLSNVSLLSFCFLVSDRMCLLTLESKNAKCRFKVVMAQQYSEMYKVKMNSSLTSCGCLVEFYSCKIKKIDASGIC